jgi:hypothetical protein
MAKLLSRRQGMLLVKAQVVARGNHRLLMCLPLFLTAAIDTIALAGTTVAGFGRLAM